MDSTLTNLVAAVASAVAAIASVSIAVVLGRRAEAFSAFSASAEWRRDLNSWAAEAVDALSEAEYCCKAGLHKRSTEHVLVWRHRISALVDRGRLFLPNVRPEEHGRDKLGAFKGYRHAALDPLVAAEVVLSTGRTGIFPDVSSALNEMRKIFVSELQNILDPMSYNREIARMLEVWQKGDVSDPTFGGLLPDSDSTAPGAESLLTGRVDRKASGLSFEDASS